MLPIPFIKFIPKLYKDDPKAIALADNIDADLATWKKDIIDMKRFNRVDEIPPKYLAELDELLNANVLNDDSELQKRKKIRDAVETHKIRGSFNNDVKIRIDNITGISPGSRILRYDFFDTDDFILTGDGLTDPLLYWGALGADGIDTGLGVTLVGAGTELYVAGNIYIDAHEGLYFYKNTPIFYAGMEVDLSEWDSTPSGGGGAVTRGTPGLHYTAGCLKNTLAGAGSTAYGENALTISGNTFVLSFYMNIDNLTMADGDQFFCGRVYDGTNFLIIQLRRSGTDYQISESAFLDGGGSTSSGWHNISKTGDVLVKIIMNKETAVAASDGELYLYIDDSLVYSITTLDNKIKFEAISDIRMGGYLNVDAGTSGDLLIDEVYIWDGVRTLTDAEIAKIVQELEMDVAPAYMRIFIGYVDESEIFQQYAIIE